MAPSFDSVRDRLDELSLLIRDARVEGSLDRDQIFNALDLIHRSLENLTNLVERSNAR